MRIFVYEHVTAGGLGSNTPVSLQREGDAMLAAVVADFQRVHDTEVVTIEHNDPENRAFEQAARQCDWTLVIAPEFDACLLERSEAVVHAGGRLLGPSPAAIELTGDKLALADFWRIHHVPHPWTKAASRVHVSELAAPLVVKPRFGAGSQETYLVQERSQLERHVTGDILLQQYIAGSPASVALLISNKQTLALAPCRQHLSYDGRFRYLGGSLPLPGDLAERATRIARQAVAGIEGLSGYVGVDLVLGDDGVDYAIEINPRLTTSYLGLRQLCRQNLAELMLRCASGEWMEPPTWKEGEVRFEA